ncbi:helicase-related protein [Candidatus Solirubrobacter pratensis]|uniref:helicase-related protein n=1 Tax=Candidatus Solirubrobacter pratensis TaxID=1298857 RepID=UPI00048179EB|nr:DEAD/DEAH box helicase [Candidatus Solirubrobacter pratensis]
MSYALLDDALIDEIASSSPADRESWLILEAHERYLGHWEVNSLGDFFRFDLRDIIGPHRVVSPANLEEFLRAAEEHGYRVAFGEDPEAVLAPFTRLAEAAPVTLTSTLPGTVNGLLPFQARGVNFLRDLPRGGVAQWSTGTGKSVAQSALLKYHLERGSFDVCLSLARAHNKINTQRTYYALAGIESVILDGTPKQRDKTYLDINRQLVSGNPVVVVTNYEKFRDDFCWFERSKNKEWLARFHTDFSFLFERNLLCLWDEMPMKLKTRTTKLYKAVQACLYDAAYPRWDKRRAESLRQYMFSATPIENDPEDWFNCVRLIDPDCYGTVKDFRERYVKRYSFFDNSKPEEWHNLDDMELRAAHIVHQVDKERDPEIRAQFPTKVEEVKVLDWHEPHRKVYDRLLRLSKEYAEGSEDDEGQKLNILGVIGVLQMLCNAPSAIGRSAALREVFLGAVEDGDEAAKAQGSEVARRLVEDLGTIPTDEGHTKFEQLRNDITVRFKRQKVIVFTAGNETIIPIIEQHFQEWGVSYVRYDGSRTQMQEAEDSFKGDPDVQVFLSSDKGSDSISLECAVATINYDGPWKWSTRKQRINRNDRVTTQHETLWVIDYVMANSVEDRKRAVVAKKQGYHQAVFEGVIANQSLSAGMSGADLRYILSG